MIYYSSPALSSLKCWKRGKRQEICGTSVQYFSELETCWFGLACFGILDFSQPTMHWFLLWKVVLKHLGHKKNILINVMPLFLELDLQVLFDVIYFRCFSQRCTFRNLRRTRIFWLYVLWMDSFCAVSFQV